MPFLALANGYGHLLLGNGCLIYHQMHARTCGFRPSAPIDLFKEVAENFIVLGDLANIRPAEEDGEEEGREEEGGFMDRAAPDEARQARQGRLSHDGHTSQEGKVDLARQTEEDKLGGPLPRMWSSWNDYKWGLGLHELGEEELESMCAS